MSNLDSLIAFLKEKGATEDITSDFYYRVFPAGGHYFGGDDDVYVKGVRIILRPCSCRGSNFDRTQWMKIWMTDHFITKFVTEESDDKYVFADKSDDHPKMEIVETIFCKDDYEALMDWKARKRSSFEAWWREYQSMVKQENRIREQMAV